jgi:hypothetical protein
MTDHQKIRLDCSKHGVVEVRLEAGQKVAACKHCIGEAYSRYVTEGEVGDYMITHQCSK